MREEDDHFSWLRAVKTAVYEADQGQLIDNREVKRWIKSLGTENPLPVPRPKRRYFPRTPRPSIWLR